MQKIRKLYQTDFKEKSVFKSFQGFRRFSKSQRHRALLLNYIFIVSNRDCQEHCTIPLAKVYKNVLFNHIYIYVTYKNMLPSSVSFNKLDKRYKWKIGWGKMPDKKARIRQKPEYFHSCHFNRICLNIGNKTFFIHKHMHTHIDNSEYSQSVNLLKKKSDNK